MLEPETEPLSILLVEDNAADARMIREALDGCDVAYDLHVAVDAEEGLEYVRQQGRFANEPRPNLVLLDLMLPGDSGFVVLDGIKRSGDLYHIPVVVLTGSRLEQDLQKSFSLSADGHIRKPLGLAPYIQELKFALSFATAWNVENSQAAGTPKH
jgi:chemotaxis family two-component system response regulator Rcp1